MYCRECGQLISNEGTKCTNCETEKGLGDNYCYKCASIIKKHDLECCEFCGADLKNTGYVVKENVKSKSIALFLALFLGGMGIHRFYLGYFKIGIVQLLLWILGYFTGGITWIIAEMWAFIECILIFINKINDSNGNYLK